MTSAGPGVENRPSAAKICFGMGLCADGRQGDNRWEMPVETLYLSGPSGCGKTTLALLIAKALQHPAHLVRMCPAADQHTNTIVAENASPPWASAYKVSYTPDRVFETLPEALRPIRQREHRPFVLIVADADPALRHAYPYDYRTFIMRPPADLHEVFRDESEAAAALREVMQDTASFASEIFGVMDSAGLEDTLDASAPESPGPRVEESESSEIAQFLDSPLGAEIAARIQLQPPFYALVESDVSVINVGRSGRHHNVDECVRRLNTLLDHVRHETRRHSILYAGDLSNPSDPVHTQLAQRFARLFRT